MKRAKGEALCAGGRSEARSLADAIVSRLGGPAGAAVAHVVDLSAQFPKERVPRVLEALALANLRRATELLVRGQGLTQARVAPFVGAGRDLL